MIRSVGCYIIWEMADVEDGNEKGPDCKNHQLM